MNKIKDNPSYAKMRTEMEGANMLRKALKVLSYVGIKDKELNKTLNKVPVLLNELNKISSIPDRFNEAFSAKGWIAHESMNFDLMAKAVECSDNGKYEEGNQMLIDYYCSEEIKWPIAWTRQIPAFNKRYDLILSAYKDSLEGRYYAAIPILLMVIDGGVNDIDKNKGFFTPSTDLTAWDSIAAHSTGLSVIRDTFNSKRNRTNTDPIYLPYRNGILHGRDINYANKEVMAKCWATLIAIYDWAKAIQSGKKTPPPSKKEAPFRETLIKAAEIHRRNQDISNRIEIWEPRKIVCTVGISMNGTNIEYKDFTPEREAVQFVIYWYKRNYGNIAKQIYRPQSKDFNIGVEAKRVREILEDKALKNCILTKIDDKAPAVSEIGLSVEYVQEGVLKTRDITLRLICEGDDGRPGMFGDTDCYWRFIDSFFYSLDI